MFDNGKVKQPVLDDAYRLSMEQMQAMTGGSACSDFELCGHTFTLFDGVFSPAVFPSTGIFTSALPVFRGASLLEIGCGAGATAVVAATSGCSPVVGVDINARAVANARHNIKAYGLDSCASVRESDLFSAIGPTEVFDLIYWNSSFVFVDRAYEFRSPLERAFFDPGYEAHRRYFEQAPRHLTESGRLLLGFSELGDAALMSELADQGGLRLRTVHEEVATEAGKPVRYMLLEAIPVGEDAR